MLKHKSYFLTALIGSAGAVILLPCIVLAQSPIPGFNSTTDNLYIGAASQIVMTILADGKLGKVGVGIGDNNPQALLDVEGEIKIGNSGITCATTNEGSLRYNLQSHSPEYCNGTAWQSFGGGVPSGTIAAYNTDNCPAGWVSVPALNGRTIVADGQANGFNAVSFGSSGIATVYVQSIAEAGPGGAVAIATVGQPVMPWYALHYCMEQ